ncbi:MAG: hypothetical protein ACI8Y8_003056, partial [Planctomycetota bacterium]
MSPIRRLLPIVDLLMAPFVFPSAWLLEKVRRAGLDRMPLCRRVLLGVGVLPIRNHYYEPQFDMRAVSRDFDQQRPLPGVEWNPEEQVAFCESLSRADELADLPLQKPGELAFWLENSTFEAGDAEYWYQLIRSVKPRRIIEIGSGNSTLMAIRALRKNAAEDPSYACEHTCIEPYEMPWLEDSGVNILRKRVEELDVSFFAELEENDILFI